MLYHCALVLLWTWSHQIADTLQNYATFEQIPQPESTSSFRSTDTIPRIPLTSFLPSFLLTTDQQSWLSGFKGQSR